MRYFLVIFFFCPLLLRAQDSVYIPKDTYSPIIKFSHLSLLDPLQSIQFALEHQLGGKFSLQHELGYIFNYENYDIFSFSSYTQSRGIRLRNELRFYLDRDAQGPEGFYFAPELLYNFVRFNKRASVGRDCNGADCQYFEYMYYRAQKQVFALHLKVGYQELIFNRLAFDIYGGLGGRHVKEVNIHPPKGLQANDRFHYNGEKYISNWPSVSLGFKLGYLLVKRAQSKVQNNYYPEGDYPYYIEQ